jgi:hypothetical protein
VKMRPHFSEFGWNQNKLSPVPTYSRDSCHFSSTLLSCNDQLT